jgi:hypothetical protein
VYVNAKNTTCKWISWTHTPAPRGEDDVKQTYVFFEKAPNWSVLCMYLTSFLVCYIQYYMYLGDAFTCVCLTWHSHRYHFYVHDQLASFWRRHARIKVVMWRQLTNVHNTCYVENTGLENINFWAGGFITRYNIKRSSPNYSFQKWNETERFFNFVWLQNPFHNLKRFIRYINVSPCKRISVTKNCCILKLQKKVLQNRSVRKSFHFTNVTDSFQICLTLR